MCLGSVTWKQETGALYVSISLPSSSDLYQVPHPSSLELASARLMYLPHEIEWTHSGIFHHITNNINYSLLRVLNQALG